jgi:hypothetical protein
MRYRFSKEDFLIAWSMMGHKRVARKVIFSIAYSFGLREGEPITGILYWIYFLLNPITNIKWLFIRRSIYQGSIKK